MFFSFAKLKDSIDDTKLEKVASKTKVIEPIGPPRFIKLATFNKLWAKPSGNMVHLKCPAVGNPMPNITWTKDGAPILRSMGEVTYRKWAIILEDLVPKDSGHYTCFVCNIYGCVNYTTRLDVTGKLLLIIS